MQPQEESTANAVRRKKPSRFDIAPPTTVPFSDPQSRPPSHSPLRRPARSRSRSRSPLKSRMRSKSRSPSRSPRRQRSFGSHIQRENGRRMSYDRHRRGVRNRVRHTQHCDADFQSTRSKSTRQGQGQVSRQRPPAALCSATKLAVATFQSRQCVAEQRRFRNAQRIKAARSAACAVFRHPCRRHCDLH